MRLRWTQFRKKARQILGLAASLGLQAVAGAACNSAVDAEDYDTTCVADDDCMLVPFEDVCSECVTVAIATSEEERAERAIEDARNGCIFGVSECLQTMVAKCIEFNCMAVPASEL